MKILLFNLGSIEDRIFEWEIEGFQTLFAQDIILWGPIPDKKFSYGGKEIPILNVSEPTLINSVFSQLPEGWYPDIVTCDTSVLNYVPDIYKCPVKTILFTRDAWSDTIFNKRLVELFDFFNYGTIDRATYYKFQSNILPLSNFAVSTPGKGKVNSEFEKRDIDVIAIANYDRSFYHERYKIFYKLAVTNNKGLNIKYFRGIKRSEIYTLYQRSKIVIDWAHTLSNRSYEAALNGCLLFSHKDNLLLKEFWIPWEEYIPYDEKNVLELIAYYIKNPELAEKVINNAREKIQRIPASWGEAIWENIKIADKTNVSIQERIRRNESTPEAVLTYRASTPFLYNYDYSTEFPANWESLYFDRIDDALSASEDINTRIAPLIEAARFAFLLQKQELAEKYLNELHKALPDYAWTYYLNARIYFDQGNNNEALTFLQKAIEAGSKYPELLKQYVLPVIEKGNACDGRRVTSYMWESVYNQDNEFQVKSLLHLSFELSGDVYIRLGDQNKAVAAYSEAVQKTPVPDCIYKISPLLISTNDYKALLKITDEGIDNSPYDNILILYKAYALISLKQKRKAFKILKEHKNALKSFIGVRKLKKLKMSIVLILPLIFLSIPISSKIIIKLIGILKKKVRYS
jgi:tetratricopeptide (TPR) repeat protein